MRLTVDGTAGHGSMTNSDNAITELCEAVGRLGRHKFPVRVTKTVRSFLDELSDALGTELDPEDMEETLAKLGGIAKIIGATLQNTAAPTQLAPATRSTSSRARRPRPSTAGSCPATRRNSSPIWTGFSARGSSARTFMPTRHWRPVSTVLWWRPCSRR